MGASYQAITGDGEVLTKGEVQVEETRDVETKATYSLNYIDTQIAIRQTQLVEIQAIITELQTLRALVDAEADDVVLKK